MKRIVLDLTEAEAAAILRSEGLYAGHGIYRPAPLRRASMKLIQAVSAALAPCDGQEGPGS